MYYILTAHLDILYGIIIFGVLHVM